MINPHEKNYRNLDVIHKTSKPIFFVGMMGSGKSTIGRCIAQMLKYDFFEMDSILEERIGMTTSAIFQEKGEEFFRHEENKLLDELLLKKHAIISCGGGVFTNDINIQKINNTGISVFLNVNSSVLKSRLKGDEKRPLLKEQTISSILLKRIPFYTQAHVMVDITYSSIEKNILQVTQEIARYLA